MAGLSFPDDFKEEDIKLDGHCDFGNGELGGGGGGGIFSIILHYTSKIVHLTLIDRCSGFLEHWHSLCHCTVASCYDRCKD